MIIDCAVYTDGVRNGTKLTVDQASGHLRSPSTFAWLGLRMPPRDELADALQAFGFEGLDPDETLAAHERPSVTTRGTATWLVLRTAHYNTTLDIVVLGELSVIVDERCVITVRHGQASPLTGVRGELEGDPERLKLGPPAVLSAVIRQVIDDYGPTVDGLERDVLEAEAEVFADTRHRPVKRLYLLRRQVRELLVAADALYEPLARLVRTQGNAQCAAVVDELNESVDLLNRVVVRTRTLSDLLMSALDANLTQVSLQQNEDMRRISAWVAIGVAPTLLAGIYGMNFDHMPELHSRWGYPFALALMLAVGLALHRAFKRSEWL